MPPRELQQAILCKPPAGAILCKPPAARTQAVGADGALKPAPRSQAVSAACTSLFEAGQKALRLGVPRKQAVDQLARVAAAAVAAAAATAPDGCVQDAGSAWASAARPPRRCRSARTRAEC
eukprot:366331-Chlamydomonas_euryale.AAC.28